MENIILPYIKHHLVKERMASIENIFAIYSSRVAAIICKYAQVALSSLLCGSNTTDPRVREPDAPFVPTEN